MKTKSILSVVLSALMVLSVFSVGFTAQAADSASVLTGEIRNGTTGDCAWKYDTEKEELTISGNGKMGTEEESEKYPWHYFSIKSIVIENGVTNISSSAFEECDVEKLTIGNSVEIISDYAFANCQKLTSVTIPESVKDIDFKAFYNCRAIETLTLNKGIEIIGSTAFCECQKIKSVTLPSSLNRICYNAFEYCSALETINFPSKEITIEAGAFDNTAWMNNQPDGIIYFGTVAYKLKGTAPASLTVKSGTKVIGESAFAKATKLESITLPDSLTTIEDGAFDSCTSLKKISIPKKVSVIMRDAFNYCTSLSEVELPDGLIEIPYSTFMHCHSLSKINLPDSLKAIGDNAFYDTPNLKSVTLPENLTSIGESAFESSGLASVKIPESVTDLGSYVFAGCENITSVDVPSGVESLGENAFSGCTSLADIKFPGTIKTIPSETLSECTALKSITIPNSVETIGSSAFSGCVSLSGVTIPSSVKNVQRSAFRGCTNLSFITIPSTLTDIEPGAFTDTKWLKNKPAGVVYINKMAYTYNGSPSSVSIKKNTTKVCDEAFDGCASLKTVKIKSGVKTIGKYAFYNCPKLSSVTLPDTLKTIDEEAFSENSALKKLTIPKSVTTIGGYAYGYHFYYDTEEGIEEYRLINGSKIYGDIGSKAFVYAFDSAPSKTLKGVEFNSNLYVKQSAKIKGIFTGKGKITYKTSDKKIATVSAAGKVKAVKKGTATITVTQNKLSWKFKVHVKKPKLNASKKTIKKGKTFKLSITGQIGTAKFSTSDKKIAKVTKKGNIKAVKKGKAVISVKTNGLTLKCKVTVK
jgi:hypothetical protein